MIILGLTGSVGMGKTTAAQMFKDAGAAIFDADAQVHKLYAKGGAAVPILRAVFPDVIIDGAIDRARLSVHLQKDPLQIKVLESFIHPMVAQARAETISKAVDEGRKVLVIDVPLLFETGGEKLVDKTVVVSAPALVQRARVLAREGMSVEKLDMILSRQMPDAEKKTRADYVIDTNKGLDFTREQVQKIMKELTG